MKNRTLFAAIAATAALAILTACGGGGGGGSTISVAPNPNPPDGGTPLPSVPDTSRSAADRHLATARFTTHQPRVLEQIGAHHAYAEGLTGKGIRIGIDDSIVDYTQTGEFGNRVKLRDADGASLAYWRPLGDSPFGDIQPCIRFGTCEAWRGNSAGDSEAVNDWVQQLVSRRGWPTRDDSLFIVDEYYSANDPIERLYRWSEVPTPYDRTGRHGTAVASTAAGKNLGVAPEATIIPIAQNLTNDQAEAAAADRALRLFVQGLPSTVRRQLDRDLAAIQRTLFTKFDIINYSWGATNTRAAIAETVEDVRWYGTYLPNTLNAIWQIGRPDAQKTISVWAAGNFPPDATPAQQHRYPALGALLPYGVPEVRGHWLAVAATDPRTGEIASYSHRCGPLPSNWDSAQHGPHYCLVAPGTVRGLLPNPNRPGDGDANSEVNGTSFAAPVVSGSLALLMEHFRGTRGNTEIVKRMLDTADRSGRYADSTIYGAGHLDLGAALSPVGVLTAGRSDSPLAATSYSAPSAYGAVGQRVGSMELATFDEQGFPFWVPLSGLVSSGGAARSPIPGLQDEWPDAPATGLDSLGLHWAALPDAQSGMMAGGGWTLGLGETSASLARAPDNDGWGYGFSYEDRGHLDGHTSGAFGSDLRSGMMWTARSFSHDLGGKWAVKATGTLALDMPRYDRDAVFRASPSMMSAASVRVGTDRLGLTVEQPLRAETGTGTFQVENGRVENGKRLHDTYRVPLRPDARELRMTLRHDFAAMGGTMALEAGGAVNTGHVEGEREVNAGIAYRVRW